MKKALMMALSLVLVAALSIGGTLAYLQDDDSDVNVMTLGNVSIEQIEQEWNAGKTALQDFTQAKPLYPFVGNFGWENTTEDGGAYRRFTMNNVVDKYVSVENTGKSDAYVRTVIALEMGDYSYSEFNMIGVSINNYDGDQFKFPGAWKWTDDFEAQIDGKNYNIMVAVHQDAVKPGETTIPSLLQVYLKSEATNEVVEKLDGNGNGTYDILVLSQAVQAAGFADAETALDAAFGDIATTNHPWSTEAPVIPTAVSTSAELATALTAGESVTLTADITLDASAFTNNTIAIDNDTVINLNGHKLDASASARRPFEIDSDADLTINAEGSTIAYGKYGLVFIKDGADSNITINGGYLAGAMDFGAVIKPKGTGDVKITLNNVTVDDHVTNQADPNEYSYLIDAAAHTGTLTVDINGGTYTVANGVVPNGYATITAKNATFNVLSCGFESPASVVTIDNCTINVVTNGNIAGKAPGTCAAASNGGSVVITNSTLTSDYNVLSIYTSGLNNSVVATNCNVNHTGTEPAYQIYTDGTAAEPTGTITVDGTVVASR